VAASKVLVTPRMLLSTRCARNTRFCKAGAICAVVFVRAELLAEFHGFVHHGPAKFNTTLQMDDLSDTVSHMEADPGNETRAVLMIGLMPRLRLVVVGLPSGCMFAFTCWIFTLPTVYTPYVLICTVMTSS